ncbi:pilus assembly PilX family protein [Aquimonas voraii]|uniref:PilX N-terminal n=1 Tax=Aquimonas voraii TaxID=265719 RepID=A0A1G6S391_9GAMM|nr:PilX N-terminal domain-containing pilus assembly protein [Aquimonas voraii]SDD10617.1 PilX N-terminal [Aquimonas voraii]
MPALRPPRAQTLHRQRGAALFVSMMILILMTLLAISASQVTSLQEKMVQAYWADVRAFEGAEERLRVAERELRAQAVAIECPEVDETAPPVWVQPNTAPVNAGQHAINLSQGEQSRGSGVGGSLAIGAQDAAQCAYFLLSASESDSRVDDDARSWAVVQSVYVP